MMGEHKHDWVFCGMIKELDRSWLCCICAFPVGPEELLKLGIEFLPRNDDEV